MASGPTLWWRSPRLSLPLYRWANYPIKPGCSDSRAFARSRTGTGLSGDRIEFRADGTGDLHSWGVMFPDDHLAFRWTATGPCRIEILVLDEKPLSICEGEGDSVEEEWRVEVVYEFFAVPELGTILMRDASRSEQDSFWTVQCPVQLDRCP